MKAWGGGAEEGDIEAAQQRQRLLRAGAVEGVNAEGRGGIHRTIINGISRIVDIRARFGAYSHGI